MRIEKLVLRNYRAYQSQEIVFPAVQGCDLWIFVADNTVGKTTILNAVNWCLYYDEPHRLKKSEGLPVPNLLTVRSEPEGSSVPVKVEIWTRSSNNEITVFSREASYKVIGEQAFVQSNRFVVRTVGTSGDSEFYENQDAIDKRDRFLPVGLRDYFFFDAEKLDHYFEPGYNTAIEQAVLNVSQVGILKDMEKNLEDLEKEYRRSGARLSPSAEKAEEALDKANTDLKDAEDQLRDCGLQIEKARSNLAEITSRIQGYPDAEALEIELQKLKTDRKTKEDTLVSRERERFQLMTELMTLAKAWPAVKKAIDTANEKEAAGEIPPNISPDLLKQILGESKCQVCGRDLDAAAVGFVTALMEKYSLSTKAGVELSRLHGSLQSTHNTIRSLSERIRATKAEVDILRSEIDGITARIEDIGRRLSEINVEHVKKLHSDRLQFEQALEMNIGLKTLLIERISTFRKQVAEAESVLSSEMAKVKQAERYEVLKSFASRARDAVTRAKEQIMNETRTRLETETRDFFFKLLWRHDTYGDVSIKEDYTIDVRHKFGFPYLGTMSAAERELLALSFTLALHTVSGYDSPLFIDTPVGRVAGTQRKPVAEMLTEVSKDKQCVLLFIPDEYSSEVSRVMDPVCHKNIIKMTIGELVAGVEVVS